MDLIKDQKYKMLLKRKYSNTLNYNENNIYFGNWFELLRIIQCSDDGIYYLFTIVLFYV